MDVPLIRIALLGSLALAGCGDDAPPIDDCWPIASATPHGTVRLGIGTRSTFEPLPPQVAFVLGNQGGAYLPMDARIRALHPGDPKDFNGEHNPRTRFRALLDDGSEVGPECSATLGYAAVEDDDGWFELTRPINLEFLPLSVAEAAYDTELTLTVEVIDDELRTARDEITVFATAPEDRFADAGPDEAP